MTKTPREDCAEGSPSPLELFITGKHSCPHPLIPSNHDNCRGAVILSPGQPPQGSSQRGAEGSGGRSFPSIAATCRVARRLGTTAEAWGSLEGIQHRSPQGARASPDRTRAAATGNGAGCWGHLSCGEGFGEWWGQRQSQLPSC